MDILDKRLGDSLQEAVDGFDPKDINQALQESLIMNQNMIVMADAAKHASLLWNANLRTAMGLMVVVCLQRLVLERVAMASLLRIL